MGSGSSSSVGPRAVWTNNLKASEWGEKWGDRYPRPTVSPAGVIRIDSRDGIFCPLPPSPYPQWIQSNYEITPQKWQQWIYDITSESMDLMESLGFFDYRGHDMVTFLPTHSSRLKAHVKAIEHIWWKRGFAIHYHEEKLTNIHWRRHVREAEMNNWLEFVPVVGNGRIVPTPATLPSTAPATASSASTVPTTAEGASSQPGEEAAKSTLTEAQLERNRGSVPKDLTCVKCGTSTAAHLSTAKFCHQCAAPLQR